MPQYELFLDPEIHEARKRLPGHMRQRVKRAIDDLAHSPRPADSRDLDVTGIDVQPGIELRRLRMDTWRILYAVNDGEGWVWVLAIHRRPPYDYEDLAAIVTRLS
jgi:mRNA-degrading endonuclease RelE of RelBE toxin-antitoxin system